MFATLIKYVHFVVREPSSFFLSFFNRVVSTLLFHSQRGWRFHVRRPERQLELELLKAEIEQMAPHSAAGVLPLGFAGGDPVRGTPIVGPICSCFTVVYPLPSL